MVHRVWLITGASYGFGLSMTHLALKHGDRVVAIVDHAEALCDLAFLGPSERLVVLECDLTDPEEVSALFHEVYSTWGKVDTVFINSQREPRLGCTQRCRRLSSDADFWSAVAVSREAVKFFRKVSRPPGGRLLQMSSSLDVGKSREGCSFSVSKFALEGFFETLSETLDPSWDIKITLVEPGYFRSSRRSYDSKLLPVDPSYVSSYPRTVVYRNAFTDHRRRDSIYIGDPERTVETLYELAGWVDPPARFVLGVDALKAVRWKAASVTTPVYEVKESFVQLSIGQTAEIYGLDG